MDRLRNRPLADTTCSNQPTTRQNRKRKFNQTDSDETETYPRSRKVRSGSSTSNSPESCKKLKSESRSENEVVVSQESIKLQSQNDASPATYCSQSSSVITVSDDYSSPMHNLSPSNDEDCSHGSWTSNGSEHTEKTLTNLKACKYNVPCCVTPSSDQRVCTLPKINFADADEVWKLMCRQDEKMSLERDPKMLNAHKGLSPRMRAILLDWLIEVCEVYKLRRETYYLSVDYLDRYLSNVDDTIPKNLLQLIGITSLFVAAKVEEIYPPKIAEFAYVTDGACSEEDILRQELLLLNTLQFKINPVTVIGWLSLYMQINVTTNIQVPSSESTSLLSPPIASTKPRRKSIADRLIAESQQAEAFIFPQFTGMEFTQVTQLLDLCSLDIEMANFPYSVIAAAGISHIFNRKLATRVSGLDWDSIAPCARWMEPFYQAINEDSSPIFMFEQNEQITSPSGLKHVCPNIVVDESHTIQTHTTSLKMFDNALEIREKLMTETYLIKPEESPATTIPNTVGLLTPPASNRKSLDVTLISQPQQQVTSTIRTDKNDVR